jgi:hypothetical protein
MATTDAGTTQINSSADWARAVLAAGNYPATPGNLRFLEAWADAEGGNWHNTAHYNVLGTSVTAPGSTQFNSDGVQSYTSWDQGIGATVQMFKQDNMSAINAALRAGNADQVVQQPGSALQQQLTSAWDPGGGSAYINSITDNLANPTILTGTPTGTTADYNGPMAVATTPPTPGTQTTVPGVTGTPAAATPAPADVTPGTTTSLQGTGAAIPQLPGNATWPQTEAYIRKNYPSYAWLLNIKGPPGKRPVDIIHAAVNEGWDATKIQANIAQTPWWQKTSTALRQYQQNKATNPGDLDFANPGSSAQQKLGDIQDAAKSVGLQLPQGIAQNLATEALMYNWDSTQIRENIGSVAATGQGQVYSPSYLSGVEANPEQYNIGGHQPTGPIAASAITTVRNAIAGQGYNPADFNDEDIDNLATEYMKFGWDPQQLAAAVIKVGAGGSAYQLDPSYTQGMLTNPQQYSFGNPATGEGPGVTAQKAMTAVREAIASAGKTIGGKGGITEQQVQELAQESMMFNWDSAQLSTNINNLGKGGGLLSPGYLQGLLTNAQEYQPGGQAYVQAHTAVVTQAAQSGVQLSADAIDALTEAYMQQGWQDDPGKLALAIGQAKGSGAVSSQYLTGMQANPGQYQPGGVTYKAAESAVTAAIDAAGKTGITPNDKNLLVQQYMQQGWTEGSPQLTQAVGAMKGSGSVSSQYLTQYEQNRQSVEPGGVLYKAATNAVQSAVAQAGKLITSPSAMDNLVRQYLQQGWNSGSPGLTEAINKAPGQSGYSQAYLTQRFQNAQQLQPGGSAYQAAVAAVQGAVAQAGKLITSPAAMDKLAQEYIRQGWNGSSPGLTEAINKAPGKSGYSQQYISERFQNIGQVQPGGSTYDAAVAAVKGAIAQSGKVVKPSDVNALVQQYLQQGWNAGSQGLTLAIGDLAGKANFTSQYLTGVQANPQQYLPGGTSYLAAQNTVVNALRQNGVAPGSLTQDETSTLIDGVMQQGWDPTTLSNEIGAMAHKGAPYNAQYLTGLAANPLEYQFSAPGAKTKNGQPAPQTLADQVLTQVEMVAGGGQNPVNLTPAQAKEVAKAAMQSGGPTPSDQLIQSLIARYVTVAPPAPTTTTVTAPGGDMITGPNGPVKQVTTTTPGVAPAGLGAVTTAPATLQQLRTQASDYFVQPSDQVLQNWARQLIAGTQTQQDFDAYLASQAAMKYPGMAPLIQQGQQPTAIADNLRNLASSTLEIDPTQVNFTSNPQFTKLLDGGANGGMMTTSEAGDYLRALPQYQYTTGARAQAATATQAILETFGRVA